MQLTKTLKVTPEELFDALAGSIMQDIESATGKRPSRNKLNGYKYEKRARSAKGMAKGTAIKVKIKHFDYPCLYEVRFQYAAGINTMRYEAAPAGDGACELTYTEDFQGVGGNTSDARGKLVNISFLKQQTTYAVFYNIRDSAGSARRHGHAEKLPFCHGIRGIFHRRRTHKYLRGQIFPLHLLRRKISQHTHFSFEAILQNQPAEVFSVCRNLDSALYSVYTEHTDARHLDMRLGTVLQDFLHRLQQIMEAL